MIEIMLNRGFDDLSGFDANVDVANESNISCEVFEKKTRMNFKVCKCKLMGMNCKNRGAVELSGEEMEWIKEHDYLGSIISENGERFTDMKSRIAKSNSVANEIFQICTLTELANIRLVYVRLLMQACLDGKIKYGCALWNVTKYKSSQHNLNAIKPRLLKRVLQVPSSTPSAAIQFEFGVNDLTLELSWLCIR